MCWFKAETLETDLWGGIQNISSLRGGGGQNRKDPIFFSFNTSSYVVLSNHTSSFMICIMS